MSISTLSPVSTTHEFPVGASDASITPVELAHDLVDMCKLGQDDLGVVPWRYVEDAIGRMSGETDGWITREFSATRKNTILAMISEITTIRENEQNPNKPQTVNIANNLDTMFLSVSPNLLDHVGSLDDDFDVLNALAKVPELREAYVTKCRGLAYDLAFCDTKTLDHLTAGLLVDASSADQLSAIRTLSDITHVMQYDAGYDTAVEGAERIKELFYGHAVFGSTFRAWLPHMAALSLIDRLEGENTKKRSVHVMAREVFAREQEFALDKEFGGDWAKHRVIQLAPGIMGARSERGIIEGAAYAEGHETMIEGCMTLRELLSQEGIVVDDEQMTLFQELYTPGMQGMIEQRLGDVELKKMSLDAQFHLVTFAGIQTEDEFSRMADVSERLKDKGQYQFLEAFLATEFGDDYGDAILGIMESSDISAEQKADILSKLADMRRDIREFTDKIIDVAGIEFAGNAGTLFTNRVTDILYGIKYVTDHATTPQTVQMGSAEVSISMTMDAVMKAMGYLDQSLASLAEMRITNEHNAIINEGMGVEFGYVAGTNDRVLLMTKPRRGQVDTAMVRGKKPRINYIIGVDGHLPSTDMLERDRYTVSVRLDLDNDGVLRLDIGGKPLDYKEGVEYSEGDTPDFTIAKLISLGNWYRSHQMGGRASDYHVDLREMTPEEFAGAAYSMRNGIECSSTPLEIVRRRGRVALSGVGRLGKVT